MEVEFCPPIGLIGTDNINVQTIFMNLLVVSDTYICEDVGDCLVVQRYGRHLVCLVHVEFLGETGWKRRRIELQTWN